ACVATIGPAVVFHAHAPRADTGLRADAESGGAGWPILFSEPTVPAGAPRTRWRIGHASAVRGRRMTEAEWFGGADLEPMFDLIEGKASNRPVRLFTWACCRRVWGFFPTPSSRGAELFHTVSGVTSGS